MQRARVARAVNRSVAGRRGVALGAALGVAALVLAFFEQVVGSYGPRRELAIALAAALALLAEATRRQHNRQAKAAARAAARRLLAVPPVRFEAADPVRLGVFPPARALGGDAVGRYVARGIDEAVRAAVVSGAVVLLVGPRLVGKSRSAFEAARAAAGAAAVIAPRGPKALEELLASDGALAVDPSAEGRVVWLDGLERYAETLDADTLERLARLGAAGDDDPDAAIVATVRDADWEKLLAAAGAEGATARAVAARARTFAVPAELEPAERERARTLFGDLDFGGGIGGALASHGDEPVEPHPVPAVEEPAPAEEGAWMWVRRSPVPLLVGCAACVVVFAALWADRGLTPPTLQDRLAGIVTRSKADGWVARQPADEPIALRPGGRQSYFFLLEHDAGTASDELRIYDREGEDGLRRAWTFRPRGEVAVFQFRAASDVDEDNAVEIIGGYALKGKQRNALLPFAIEWDTGSERYRLISLDVGDPQLETLDLEGAVGTQAGFYREEYAKVVEFADGKKRIAGRRVQDFVVRPEQHRIVAAFFLKPPLASATDESVLAIRAAILQTRPPVPKALPCRFSDKPARAVMPPGWSFRQVLNEFWKTVPGDACAPIYSKPRSSASKRSPRTRQS